MAATARSVSSALHVAVLPGRGPAAAVVGQVLEDQHGPLGVVGEAQAGGQERALQRAVGVGLGAQGLGEVGARGDLGEGRGAVGQAHAPALGRGVPAADDGGGVEHFAGRAGGDPGAVVVVHQRTNAS
ncbi:MAG: hypothetical protein R3F59_30725 [Myxococcota bacterium]